MRKIIVLSTLVFVMVLSGCTKAAPVSSNQTSTSVATIQPAPLAATDTTTPKPLDYSSKADQTTPSNDTKYYFTQAGQHPEKALIDVIDSSKESLDVAIYSITHPDIVNAIKAAKKRGVSVRIITDKIESKGKTELEALKLLGSAGISIKINKHSGLMHLKVTIADKKVVTTGSYNYSKAASTTNDEVLVAISNESVAKNFSEQFDRMWNDTKGFEKFSISIAK
ncbi:phosphatidylserine/phosphatidylglycerophosphate/cardiolipin synthase-like enzyme [Paenibacillus sp. V4I9]|uniref:phospholipase D family nuclease n=1 Tax=Paenibacillus sp. V4I9 TaxID=3042308 RepID=UPI00278AB7A5|nr:phospholipase D family protein [Paenibacillus sp. V4I9]MDQ0888596.1 phosphatidylserine/phosphatidylglycerophosphate/cardiolipin synthase-like enzyme [Paenibacillus sp. V4I9]